MNISDHIKVTGAHKYTHTCAPTRKQTTVLFIQDQCVPGCSGAAHALVMLHCSSIWQIDFSSSACFSFHPHSLTESLTFSLSHAQPTVTSVGPGSGDRPPLLHTAHYILLHVTRYWCHRAAFGWRGAHRGTRGQPTPCECSVFIQYLYSSHIPWLLYSSMLLLLFVLEEREI